jgi:murein DD-endopeptidase MepM/ murein hydrolase activator NlpD
VPYNGKKAREARERLAKAVMRAKVQPLQYEAPLIESRLTSPYGERKNPFTGKRQFHTGDDLAAPEGDPVFATEDGYISQAQHKASGTTRGNNVIVTHPDGTQTRYGHLQRFGKASLKGGPVKKGDVLGYVGSTGKSTGNHLHYGMWKRGKPVKPIWS